MQAKFERAASQLQSSTKFVKIFPRGFPPNEFTFESLLTVGAYPKWLLMISSQTTSFFYLDFKEDNNADFSNPEDGVCFSMFLNKICRPPLDFLKLFWTIQEIR